MARHTLARATDLRSGGALLCLAMACGGFSTAAAAQATDAANPRETSGAAPADPEIIVTARKRDERLQDVPVPVSVLRGDDLTESNQRGLEDYYDRVPGLNLASFVGGTSGLVIRGITTGGFGNPTVGIAIDDIPYGSATGLGGGFLAADFDPSDLARIEVLRGPQGTLYGANSMGGLLKYVTVDPSFDRFGGRLQAGAEAISHSGEIGLSLRGAVNVPLADNLAIRASGFARSDAGYIDNAFHNLTDINRGNAFGFRVSGLWQLAPDTRLKLSASYQHARADGANDLDITRPGLDQPSYIPGWGGFNNRNLSLGAILNTRLGNADLVSVTGWSKNNAEARLNLSALSAAAQQFFGVTGVPYFMTNDNKKFSQEIRASVPLSSALTWLVGGFFTSEHSVGVEQQNAGDFATGQVRGMLLRSVYPTTYREYAGFSSLTINFTRRFDVQIGGRYSFIRQTYSQVRTGPRVAGGIAITPLLNTRAEAFTYLVTPRFRFSDNLMTYARVASGFRPGGPNANRSFPGVLPSYEPDTTRNYEIGFKGNILDRRFIFDVSAYHIDWRNIQLRQIVNVQGFTGNAGQAKSEGVEVSVEARPVRGLTIGGWIARNTSVLTETFPTGPLFGRPGDRLPYTPRWSGNVSIEGQVPLGGGATGIVGGSLSYVGDRISDFTATATRVTLPAYTQIDLHAGVRVGDWSTNLYLNNLTDRRGIIGVSYATTATSRTIIQPRTIGISVARSF